jgi:hypothetical protein
LHGLVGRRQFAGIFAAREANATAACGGLQHDRKPQADRFNLRLRHIRQQASSRDQRHACRFSDLARRMLQPEASDLVRCRAYERDALRLALLGEFRVFGKKAVAGDDGIDAMLLGGGDDEIAAQISFACAATR